MSLNKVQLIGNLGDDVKLHHFENGGVIGRFPLATNETYIKKGETEKTTETEWHQVIVRNKQAETIEKYVKKGNQIYVEGKIKTRKWTDDSGNDRYSTEIHVFSFTFISNKGNNSNPAVSETSGNGYSDSGNQDDLPFN